MRRRRTKLIKIGLEKRIRELGNEKQRTAEAGQEAGEIRRKRREGEEN